MVRVWKKGELQFIKKTANFKKGERFSPQAWEEFIPKAYQLEDIFDLDPVDSSS